MKERERESLFKKHSVVPRKPKMPKRERWLGLLRLNFPAVKGVRPGMDPQRLIAQFPEMARQVQLCVDLAADLSEQTGVTVAKGRGHGSHQGGVVGGVKRVAREEG
jgi:hypothetical protein